MILPMPRKSTYADLNAAMGGQLPAYLRRRSAANRSFNDMAVELMKDYDDLEVTGETIRRWVYQLGIETEQRRKREATS